MNSAFLETNTVAYTVVTPNYLAHAHALRKSFLQTNSDYNFIICLVGFKHHIPEHANLNYIFLDHLLDERIAGMTKRYNPFELSCALKPFFAKYIFDLHSHINRLIYLDGDMHVFGKFVPQSNAAITVSPHRTIHVNYLPGLDNFSTTDLLRYGIYNAGYFELLRKPETFQFLKWWQMLLENHAYFKPDAHIFTDQLWLSIIHSFFDDISINKNPGYNVGFWNMIERTITQQNNQWFVNGVPLVLFHYSTYKIEEPEKIVNFNHPMLSFSQHPELKFIFEQYRNGVLAENYEEVKQLPYPFSYKLSSTKKKWWQKIFR